MRFVALLRGVNVGGKNKVAMSELKTCLESLGFTDVSTFLNSGNALFGSDQKDDKKLARLIEEALIKSFSFDSKLIKVLVLSRDSMQKIVQSIPTDFGSYPDKYHSDVAFVMEGEAEVVIQEFDCNPDVDKVWLGQGVIFYQRLSALRTKSRLSKIVAKPIYKSLTIRTLGTVTKLLERM